MLPQVPAVRVPLKELWDHTATVILIQSPHAQYPPPEDSPYRESLQKTGRDDRNAQKPVQGHKKQDIARDTGSLQERT